MRMSGVARETTVRELAEALNILSTFDPDFLVSFRDDQIWAGCIGPKLASNQVKRLHELGWHKNQGSWSLRVL